MATAHKHDKNCQTSAQATKEDRKSGKNTVLIRDLSNDDMIYDETLEVVGQEIESPDDSLGDEQVVKTAMSKFNPPVRHTAKHDFDDSETDSGSDLDNYMDNASLNDETSPDKKPSSQATEVTGNTGKPAEIQKQSSKESTERQTVGEKFSRERARSARRRAEIDSSNSESDSADIEPPGRPDPLLSGQRRTGNVVVPAEGAYDPKNYQDLKVPPEMDNLFQYIMKYTPQKIDIEFKLQPFVPEYVPAVGDIDAFIKVTTPPCDVRAQPIAENVLEHIDNLGLTVLDEPAAEQSDSALLHLQLRAISKTNSAKSTVLTKKIENAEKNTKAIDRWIKDVSELHLSKPAPTVSYTSKMPDIDTLMEEWPESIEESLNTVGFPPPALDCSLAQYVDIVLALFDIPVATDSLNDRIQALHLLFSLYSAVKNNQLFEERQEKRECVE